MLKPQPNTFYLLIIIFLFGCVVNIFSVCVVKLTKVVFLISGVFFSICSVFFFFFFGCVVL